MKSATKRISTDGTVATSVVLNGQGFSHQNSGYLGSVPFSRSLQSILCAVVLAASPACSSSHAVEHEQAHDLAAPPPPDTEWRDRLDVALSESPSGSEDFTFCTEPDARTGLNLTNAAWLAMIASNEYAHFGYFASQLISLGFGNPEGGDALWQQCAVDMGRLRDLEIEHQAEFQAAQYEGSDALLALTRSEAISDQEHLGVCGRSFVDETYTAVDEDGEAVLPSIAFRDYLIRSSGDENYIQFYSGRPYSFVERLLGKSSTQVVIARHSEKPMIVISFRGTEPFTEDGLGVRELVDLMSTFTAGRTDLREVGFSDGWGKAHSGWVSALQSVDDMTSDGDSLLTSKLRQLISDDPDIGIWITGHSMGGVLATLMAARLIDANDNGAHFNVRGLYTFGAPKVGNDDFVAMLNSRAQAYNTEIVRFRNNDDIVTSIPLGIFSSYDHAGNLALLNEGRFDFLDYDVEYTDKNFSDHSMSGIIGLEGSRQRVSGYYSRIVHELHHGDAAYRRCGNR